MVVFVDLHMTMMIGKIRYRGELHGMKGRLFGVELSAEYQGKGTSDGEFRRKRYFKAPREVGQSTLGYSTNVLVIERSFRGLQ